MPACLRKNTISPMGKCGPSQRTAANMIANISIAMILHSMPRNGRSWVCAGVFASKSVFMPPGRSWSVRANHGA